MPSFQALEALTSDDRRKRDAAAASWRGMTVAAREDAIGRLVAGIRADQLTHLRYRAAEDYPDRYGDLSEDDVTAARLARDRLAGSQRLLSALLRLEVDRAVTESRDEESFLRLARLLVRYSAWWPLCGGGASPGFEFLEPAVGWAESTAPRASADPWAFFARFVRACRPDGE